MPATSPEPTLRRPPREPKHPRALRAASPRVERLLAALAMAESTAPRLELVDAFWADMAVGTPLVEAAPSHAPAGSALMTFVLRAPSADWLGDAFALVNKLSPVSDPDGARMERVDGTDVLHASFVVPSTWRGSYRLACIDEGSTEDIRAHARPDDLNSERLTTAAGSWSVASMPDAPARPWRSDAAPLPVRSIAGRACHVHVAGPTPESLLVLLDGETWGEHAPITPMLDHLQRAGDIASVAVVAVRAGDADQRWREMAERDDDLVRFVAEDVPTWFRTEYGHAPERAVVIGQSLGALVAARAVADDSAAYDAAVLHSPSLWYDDDAPVAELTELLTHARRERPDTRIVLGVGSDEWVLIPRMHSLLARLADAGVDDIHSDVWAGGHDTACWLDATARTLPTLLGAPS